MTKRGATVLLGEALAAKFRARDWPKGPVLRNGPARRFGGLLNAPEFESLERLMSSRHGKIMAERASGYIEVDAATALDLYNARQPIQVSGIGIGVPEVNRWARAIAKDLGMAPIVDAVRANAFAANAGGVKFPLHFDATDVIVVQLVGEKRWRLAPNHEVPYPTSGCGTFAPVLPGKDIRRYHYDAFPEPTREQKILLRPGSALYVPGGYWHGTETLGPSFSVTFVLGRPPTVDLLLDRIKFALSQVPAWNEPAYGIRGTARARKAAESELRALLLGFSKDVGKLDPEEVIDCFLARHRNLAVAPDQRFVPNPAARYRTFLTSRENPTIDRVSIKAAGKETTLRLHPDELPLARWVLDRKKPFGLWDALSHAELLNRPMSVDLLARFTAARFLTLTSSAL